METWDVIRSRRNIREFADRAIEPDDLDRILEAGRRSPSAQNWQPWDFVVVTDRRRLARLSHVARGAGPVATSAASIAIVAPVPEDDVHRDWEQFDLGQATMVMMLTAADLGIGSGHAAVGDQHLVRGLLDVPPNRWCPYLIPLGYPADRPLAPVERPSRRPFAEVVHRDRW